MNTIRRNSDIYKEGEYGEFVVRNNHPALWKLLLLFFSCFIAIFAVATHAEMFGGKLGVALAIFAIIAPLSWFTIFFNQRNRDMVLAAEFQNALFSAAARLKSKFCMIVKQDGTVFYFDRGFQRIFPETANRGVLMLDKLFSAKHISVQEAQKLDYALANSLSETIIVELPGENGEPQKIIITIDPITRPMGFFILRGRDYVVKQYDRISATETGAAKPQLLADPAASTTLQHLLQTLPVGIYATDADGKIIYINYRLESWLGYAQSEVMATGLTLQNLLLPQQNTPTAESLFLRNCQGPVIFTNKEGKAVVFDVNQEITRSENGASLGTVAYLQKADPELLKQSQDALFSTGTATDNTPTPRRLFPFSGSHS